MGFLVLCGAAGFLAFRSGITRGMDGGREAEREFRPQVEAVVRAETPGQMSAVFPPAARGTEADAKLLHKTIRGKIGRFRSLRLIRVAGFRTFRGNPTFDMIAADYEATGERGKLVFRAMARKDDGTPWLLNRFEVP